MRCTVEHGLRWLEDQFHPQPDDAWLLSPGDHPTLDAAVVQRLIAEYGRGGHSVVVPTFAGKRGHPTVIAWRRVAGIRKHPVGQGLNTYLRSLSGVTLEVAMTEASVLSDLDTIEDYERLQSMFTQRIVT